MVDVQKQQFFKSLFSVTVTDQHKLQGFIDISQKKAFEYLKRGHDIRNSATTNSIHSSSSLRQESSSVQGAEISVDQDGKEERNMCPNDLSRLLN